MERSKEPLSSQFARVYGSPGEAPRVLGLLRAFWPLLVVCLLTGYLFRAAFPHPMLSLSSVGVLFVLVAAGAAIILTWGRRRLGDFLTGAKGEEWVAHELAFLDRDYTIFNGLRIKGGKADSDHVVVAPAGIFVVETKNWGGSVEFREGRLFADGKEPPRPPLKQVKAATAELVAFLDATGCGNIPIHSVLCFLGTKLPEEIMNVNGVVVCTGDRLIDVLQESFDNPISETAREAVAEKLKNAMNEE